MKRFTATLKKGEEYGTATVWAETVQEAHFKIKEALHDHTITISTPQEKPPVIKWVARK